MTAGLQPIAANVNAQAGNLVVGLRNTFTQIATFQVWLNSVGNAGLVSLGIATGDAAILISAFSDLNDLANVYNGVASTHLTGTYNYTTFADQLTAYS